MKYSEAGVDVDKGDQFVDGIMDLARSTHIDGVIGGLGGFGGIFDISKLGYKDPLLIASTDGVGSKSMIAISTGKHFGIGIDLVAMCVNDILTHGARPIIFLDYMASSSLNLSTSTELIEGIVAGCKQAGCALLGGETAEMPGLYSGKDYDLAGFSLGIVERSCLLPKFGDITKGFLVYGLHSSGIHSNGFSLIRKIFEVNKIAYQQPCEISEGKSWGEVLLTPTRIYSSQVLAMCDYASAFAHVTGGGILANLLRVLPKGLTVNMVYNDWPEIFRWVQAKGNISTDEMLRTFNCGIGMLAVVSPSRAEDLKRVAQEELVFVGEIVEN